MSRTLRTPDGHEIGTFEGGREMGQRAVLVIKGLLHSKMPPPGSSLTRNQALDSLADQLHALSVEARAFKDPEGT